MNYEVAALAVLPNGDVVAGGRFTTAGGAAANRIARWNGTAWSALAAGLDDFVTSLAVRPNGDLVVGGGFLLADGRVSAGVAFVSTTCPATTMTLTTGCVGPAGPVVLTTSSLPWVGSTFRSKATGFAANSLAFSVVGFTSPNVPLSTFNPLALPGCSQLASTDAVTFTVVTAGSTSLQFAITADPALVGLPLFHQFLQMELNAQGALTSLSSSNGLALTVGLF